jgi:hypothetical protein
MNKFTKQIAGSSDNVLNTRAKNLSAQAKNAADRKRLDLQADINALEAKKTELTDLAPETTVDLKPGKGFDAPSWIEQVHQINVEMEMKRIELAIFNTFYEEWFTEILPQSGTDA